MDKSYIGPGIGAQITGSSYGTAARSESGRIVPSFTENIDLAAMMAGDVRARLERLADRLCGSVPTEASKPPELHAVTDGVFDQVTDIGRRIISDMERMSVAFDRIERSLP